MSFIPAYLKHTPGRAASVRYLSSRVLILRRVLGRRLAGLRSARRLPMTLAVWPPVGDPGHLGDVENRIRWYLRHTDATVLIPCSGTVLNATVSPPASQERFEEVGVTIRRVTNVTQSTVDGYLLSRVRWDGLLGGLGRPTYIVDPSFSLTAEVTEWFRLRRDVLPSSRHTANREGSAGVYQRFLQENTARRVAYVLTTGPSLDGILGQLDVSARSLRVVCNSAVRNDRIIAHVRPQVVTFADPAYHFGPSRYAAEFRRAFVRFMDMTQAIAVVPEFCGDLLISEYRHLVDRIVAMPYQKGADWNAPRPGAFFVRPHGTILTQLMIPVAAAVSSDILIAGADGRDPNDRFFWKHSSAAQFDELMASVRETHPSFFDDMDYESFYNAYCADLDSLVRNLERRGIQIGAMTKSHIPALQARDRSGVARSLEGTVPDSQ